MSLNTKSGTLGFYDGHNASCSFVKNGKIVVSIEEERLSGIKLHDGRNRKHGFPHRCVKYVLNLIPKNQINQISLALEKPEQLSEVSWKFWVKKISDPKNIKMLDYILTSDQKTLKKYKIDYPELLNISYISQLRRIKKIKKYFFKLGFKNIPIKFVSHHLSHHASVLFTNEEKRGIIFSLDGRGDALSGLISTFSDKKITIIDEISSLDSIGHFYSAVTAALKFQPVKHEGKITGLAAYGKINKKLLNEFNKIIYLDRNSKLPISKLCTLTSYGPYPFANFKVMVNEIKKKINKYSRENVAATAQKHLENLVSEMVFLYLKKYKKNNVYLAGGVFSNVKLNQRIAEKISKLNYPKLKLVVHPGMSDCGLSVGCSLYSDNYKKRIKPNNYYLGSNFNKNEIRDALINNKLKFYKPKFLENEVAQIINAGKIIALCRGRMEYGPRALGNRSIIYHTADVSVNKWLNKKLSRTEFMPFAPVSISDDVNKYYNLPKNIDIGECLKYMTITVNCTKKLKNESPAVVHIDNTARPQIIDKKQNLFFFNLLKIYKKISGKGSILNTSFNLHDKPIVDSPKKAIKAFKIAKLDFLVIDEFIAHK